MAQPQHNRHRSIPKIRLEQPLPELPPLPASLSPVEPDLQREVSDQRPFEPYHDAVPEEEMVGLRDGRVRPAQRQREAALLSPITPVRSNSPQIIPCHDSTLPGTPPNEASPVEEQTNKTRVREPMYNYLPSQPPVHYFTSPNSNTFLSPTSRPQSPVDYMPYFDEDVDHPFIITLSPLSPMSRHAPGEEAPPSYEELYLQHPCPHRRGELAALVRQMDGETGWAYDICRFVVGMIMLALCIVAFGLVFNRGAKAGNEPSNLRNGSWNLMSG